MSSKFERSVFEPPTVVWFSDVHFIQQFKQRHYEQALKLVLTSLVSFHSGNPCQILGLGAQGHGS